MVLASAATVVAAPVRTTGGASIVEIQDTAHLENYVCGGCTPADLADVALPSGFVASPRRRLLANFGEVRSLPTDPSYAVVTIGALTFQRVARVHGGPRGIHPVSPGVIVRLESDRTLRIDAGREIHTLTDGSDTYVLFARSERSDLATLAVPDGWSYSSRTLDRDLVLFDPTGLPHVYIDAQQSLWQRLTVPLGDRVPAPIRLAGARLLVVDHGRRERRRLAVRLRGDVPRPTLGAADDPSIAGGWMIVRNDASGAETAFDLPAEGWAQAKRSATWRYRDRRGQHGPCRKVTLTRTGISAVCAGAAGFSLDEPAQRTLVVGLGLGETVTYCGVFGGRIRKDVGTGGHAKGRGRFRAVAAPPPDVCPLRPIYRMPIRWERNVPVRALAVRGRDADSPLLGNLGAVNIYAVRDPAADAAYGAAVLPLLGDAGAVVIAGVRDPTFVDAEHGPASWAQARLAIPLYPGAPGLLGMVTSAAWGALDRLKAAQVGDTLHFGLQRCLHDCDAFTGAPLPPRLSGRILAIHCATSRAQLEDAIPGLAAEASDAPGLRLGWAGRTVADVVTMLDDGRILSANHPLGADGSLLYVLDPGVEPADVLALPSLRTLLASSDAYAAAFFGP